MTAEPTPADLSPFARDVLAAAGLAARSARDLAARTRTPLVTVVEGEVVEDVPEVVDDPEVDALPPSTIPRV